MVVGREDGASKLGPFNGDARKRKRQFKLRLPRPARVSPHESLAPPAVCWPSPTTIRATLLLLLPPSLALLSPSYYTHTATTKPRWAIRAFSVDHYVPFGRAEADEPRHPRPASFARSTPSYAPDLLATKLLALVESSFDKLLDSESRDGPEPTKRERREAFRAMAEGFTGSEPRMRALIDSIVRVRPATWPSCSLRRAVVTATHADNLHAGLDRSHTRTAATGVSRPRTRSRAPVPTAKARPTGRRFVGRTPSRSAGGS